MIEPAHTFEHAGLTVNIRWEECIDDNDNPRKNQDGNVGVMFCEHSRYDLGDTDAEDPREHEVECDKCEGSGEVEMDGWMDDSQPGVRECPKCEGTGVVELSLIEYLRDVKKARVALPLFLYDHSGLSMSCGANLLADADDFSRKNRVTGDGYGWDVSSVGLIYFDPEQAEKWGRPETDDEQIEKELREEVAYYDAYLRGNVYGYEIVDAEGEVLDSCWGFLETSYPGIGDDQTSVTEQAKEAAESCAEDIVRERELAYEAACRDVVTV